MVDPRMGFVALAALAACASTLTAQNGGAEPAAMFRGGAAHTGVYADAISGRALLGIQWRFVTEGDVIASPAVAGDLVYVGSGDGRMYALDRVTGAVRWSRDMGSPIASSPAVGTRRVFFGTRDGRFHALDAATGEVRWRLTVGPDFPWPWGHESGDVYTSSPVHVNGTVIFGSGDGHVYALDARTGRQHWRAVAGGRVRSSPAVDGGRVYVGSADGRVYAFDLRTGALRWRYDTEGVRLESRNFGYDRRTVQSSPAVSGRAVYVGARDGFLYAIDATTGQLRWRVDHKLSWVNTSPAVQDGVVYAGSSDGQFVQAVNAATGEEIWRAKSGVTWSSPAVAGDVVYAGDGAGRVNALDRRTGQPLWTFRTGSTVYASPVPAGDLVFVGSTDGSVYALRVGGPDGAPRRLLRLDVPQVGVDRRSSPSFPLLRQPRLHACRRARTRGVPRGAYRGSGAERRRLRDRPPAAGGRRHVGSRAVVAATVPRRGRQSRLARSAAVALREGPADRQRRRPRRAQVGSADAPPRRAA
jgi:outer membrane protein assembly factor BamB